MADWRTRFRNGVEQTEDLLLRIAIAAKTWLWGPALWSVAIGSAVWAYRLDPTMVAKLGTNRMSLAERMTGVWVVAYAAAGVLALYLGAIVVDRFRSKRWRVVRVASTLNRLLAWAAALPFAVALSAPGIEKKSPIWTVVLCAIAGGAAAVSAYHLPWRREWPRRAELLGRWAAPVVVVGLAAAYSYTVSDLAIAQHHSMHSRTIDLGIYDNIFYQSIHGRPLGCTFIKGNTHLSGHFDPILVVLSPLYLLYPRAEMLLVLQSVWCAAGVIPLYLLTVRFLESRIAAILLCIAYLVYPAMHGANLYEFHSLTLVTPLLVWALYFLETRGFKRFWVTMVLLWLVREDVPLVTAFIGIYAILRRERPYLRLGLATILLSGIYFYVSKSVFMKSAALLGETGKESYSHAFYFKDLIPNGAGSAELLMSLITNPIFALEKALTNEGKILYFLVLFVPLALVPLFAKKRRIMLLFGSAVALLATREAVFKPHFQYSCIIFPMAFASIPMALRELRQADWVRSWTSWSPHHLSRAALGAILVCSLLMSWKFGALVPNKSFRAGFAPLRRELTAKEKERYAIVRRLVDQIEPGASVTATNALGPHISNRAEAYQFKQVKDSHYWFVWDREIKKPDTKQWMADRVRRGGLELVDQGMGIKLYRTHLDKDISKTDWRREKNKRRPPPRPKPRPRKPNPSKPTDKPTDKPGASARPAPSGRPVPSATPSAAPPSP